MKSANTHKIEQLKEFSYKNIFHTLNNIKDELPDSFINEETLYTKTVLKDRIEKVLNCSTVYAYSSDLDKTTGETRNHTILNNACSCYVLCPVCSNTRSFDIRSKYEDDLENLLKKYPLDRVYFITFTLKNCDSFQEMYNKFNTSIRSFFKQGQSRYGVTDRGESSKIDAGIMGIECKQGKESGKWNIHGHMLAFCNDRLDYFVYDQTEKKKLKKLYPDRIPKNKLTEIALHKVIFQNKEINCSKVSSEWFKATNGTSINVKVNPISKTKDLKKQLKEIIKYPTKISDLPKDKMLELLIYKDRKRFLRIYGDLRGVSKKIDMSKKKDNENQFETVSIGNRKFDYSEGKFSPDDRIQAIAEELNEKREEVTEFFTGALKARHLKNKILDSIKKEVFIKTLRLPEYKQSIIKEVNALYESCKAYTRYLYEKIVLKNDDPSVLPQNEMMYKYFKQFVSLKLA